MTLKFTTSEEDSTIIEEYKKGEYTYQQLADNHNLSKGTVINIVKGYPYTDKTAHYSKLQKSAMDNLIVNIKSLQQSAKCALESKNQFEYGNHIQQLKLLMDMSKSTQGVYEKLKDLRTLSEKQAWECFGNNDYSGFGYNASVWRLLTDTIADNAKDPWAPVVQKVNAKSRSKSIKFSNTKTNTSNCYMYQIGAITLDITVSDTLWKLIKPHLTGKYEKGDREILNIILNCIMHGLSFKRVVGIASRMSFHRKFNSWYRYGVFAALLCLQSEELTIIENELWEIEKYRLMYSGDCVPRIRDIKRMAGKE